MVQLLLNGKTLDMEVDTGAALSVISEATRIAVFPNDTLHPSNLILTTYTDQRMKVTGTLNVRVQYGSQRKKLVLVVVSGDGPSLLGRNWLKYIRLNWAQIFAVHSARMKAVDALLTEHQTLFSEELGDVKPFTASLKLQPDATPRFFKPRPIPYAIKDAVNQEITCLEKQGIISPVSHSQWASPIVTVPKKDGRFRLCGDYKVTVNQVLDVEEYPLPTPEELFSTLSGGKIFSKLDLSQAYLQVPVDEKSKPYLTVNTHRGLFTYNRLPFGVASAPAIFQKIMDTILQGVAGVTCYLDDILVSSSDEDSHIRSLQEVFARLEKHGFRLKREKCEFFLPSVEYLGHVIDEKGIHPLPTKVEAITNAPTPVNVQQLRSFLGLVNYYRKFIPNLSTTLHPLNDLLAKQKKWEWSEECTKAFKHVKEQITSDCVLTHYNPDLPITLAGDASAYGVGAVISHVFPDGTERPLAFASRTLSSTERGYAQLEKEALSLIYAVKKFHKYLYGRKFLLVTDHKPLVTILGPKKGTPTLAAARLQRWAMLLSAYRYEIRFKSTQNHGNADGLSRLPLSSTGPSCDSDAVSTFTIAQVQALPVSSKDIQQATRRDAVLSKVYLYVQQGWPGQVSDELKTYSDRRAELSVENGCLLWGTRVIIPSSLQHRVLKSLHENHPGITRMKSIARSYFWWRGLDRDIETTGKSCHSCQENQSNPATAPLHPWIWPDSPWRRIHVDFAGPFLGHSFFVVVDAHSKWPEVVIMKTTTAAKTIEVLREMFARHGLPEQLVSDSGPQFVADEFKQFLKRNGVKHIQSATYHPSSNGLAERFVQTLKRALKASRGKDTQSIQHRLAEFLFEYRATPHATTGVSPGQLFLNRKLRTRFDLMLPNTKEQVTSKQAKQKQHHDTHSKSRFFVPGTSVWTRLYRGGSKWISGTVLQQLGPVTYSIQVTDGGIVKRHVDQLRQRVEPETEPDSAPTVLDNQYYPTEQTESAESNLAPPSSRRYPQRQRRPPDRYMT